MTNSVFDPGSKKGQALRLGLLNFQNNRNYGAVTVTVILSGVVGEGCTNVPEVAVTPIV